jgi:putative phosphoribosyl transferase
LTISKEEAKGGLIEIVQIPVGKAYLEGELGIPPGARGVVLFAHGSGSTRHSPRNQFVARTIREADTGTLLFDLLTREELKIVPRATHLFEEPGALQEVARLAADWFRRHLRLRPQTSQ